MGEIRIKRDAPDWDNKPAHQITNGQFVDIPTHHFINDRWQGELTSQSPLKFRADGEMLDWRIEGKTSGNLLDFNALKNAPMGTIGTVSNCPHVLELQLKPSTTYTMASNGTGNETAIPANSYRSVYFADSASPNAVFVNHPVTITTDLYGVIKVGFFSDRTNAQQYLNGTAQLWLIEGSTALPYEPYGSGVGDYDETEQKYRIPVRVEGENLFDTSVYTNNTYLHNCTVTNTSTSVTITSTGTDPFVGFVNSPGTTVPERAQLMYIPVKPNTTYTINMSSAPKCYCTQVDESNVIKKNTQINRLPYSFTTDKSTTYVIIRLGDDTLQVGESRIFEDIQLLEGTYTSSTIPPYEVSIFTDHQLMDGDSIDYTTTETQIPIATGNNTLSVDTAVQPSKVFVKFEG